MLNFTPTICPYCGVGCGMLLAEEDGALCGTSPLVTHPVSQGRLCIKGWNAPTVAGLARAFGSGAMTNSIAELAETDCLLVIGSNPTEAHPIIGGWMMRAKQQGAKLIVVDPRKIHLADSADLHLRPRLGSDIALLNGMMRIICEEGWSDQGFIQERTEGFEAFKAKIQEYPLERVEALCGIGREQIRAAAELYARSSKSTIFYTLGITEHICGTNNVLSLANLAMITGHIGRRGTGVNPLRGQNNVQGACDMGVLPNVYSGYQKVTDEAVRTKFGRAWKADLPSEIGITEIEMFHAADAGQVKGMYIFGENPLLGDPNVNHVKKALGKLEFLVVQDIFMTEVARVAAAWSPSITNHRLSSRISIFPCSSSPDGISTTTIPGA